MQRRQKPGRSTRSINSVFNLVDMGKVQKHRIILVNHHVSESRWVWSGVEGAVEMYWVKVIDRGMTRQNVTIRFMWEKVQGNTSWTVFQQVKKLQQDHRRRNTKTKGCILHQSVTSEGSWTRETSSKNLKSSCLHGTKTQFGCQIKFSQRWFLSLQVGLITPVHFEDFSLIILVLIWCWVTGVSTGSWVSS